jgi:hypothetical protein
MTFQRTAMAAILVAAAASAGGCSSMNNTEKGAGIGGLIGAGAGTAIGAATGNPKTGAVVGGLLGAGVGGAVGNQKDNEIQERREIQQANAVANAQAQQRMGITDVIHMVQQGHDEQVIINQIRSTGSTFQLSANDLDFLKQNGVPPRVIVEMQSARAPVMVAPARPVVIHDSPTVIYRDPPPVVIYRRPPPPPGFYFGYRGW